MPGFSTLLDWKPASRVNHLCPQRATAIDLGTDWSEERGVGRAAIDQVEGRDTANLASMGS